MSATKAKPAGRAVRIRKCVDEMLFTPGSYCVEGYTGSARQLKRLAEIAGMDEEEIFRRISNANGLIGLASIDAANRIMEALGLSTAQGRKGKRS